MPMQNIILAEFCSEIPIANGQTTVLQLMDVSSGPHSIFETTFRQQFSLPIDTTCDHIHTHNSGEVTPSIASDAVLTPKVHQCTPPTTKSSTVMTPSDDLSHGEDRMMYMTSCANLAEDTSHVDDVFSNNALLSTEYAVEPSVYLKHFVGRTSTLTYGWFETTGPQPIDTPPNFSSFDNIQLGDLFLHHTDQKVVCWIRKYSPSGGVWRMILPGDNGSHNEDFSRRILVLHSDGNPTWVLPKTHIMEVLCIGTTFMTISLALFHKNITCVTVLIDGEEVSVQVLESKESSCLGWAGLSISSGWDTSRRSRWEGGTLLMNSIMSYDS
ncbi:uncharacterized protein F5147DRAFT_659111 [Suillus discolor]|uniref:Uncharacterized protein n=1 Tax=Suillus discolor TaxID=1912936 RepID=A0A9P7ESJ2_9AGAM|nr:uncharacterized protein F5147DRAFT_659111 [Suillus discolor]KAG2086812.1 hypothetical protein F5147DRAFT_659111 [Suillus discolor]